MKIDDRTADYIKTIADAAVAGTVSKEGLKVVGWIMRGWTLDAAKHKVFVEDCRK